MKTTKQNKPITINTRLRAIRAFFNFLYDERYIKKNPVKDLKVRRDAIPVFSNSLLWEVFYVDLIC
jgi:integrase/recombinase XerD